MQVKITEIIRFSTLLKLIEDELQIFTKKYEALIIRYFEVCNEFYLKRNSDVQQKLINLSEESKALFNQLADYVEILEAKYSYLLEFHDDKNVLLKKTDGELKLTNDFHLLKLKIYILIARTSYSSANNKQEYLKALNIYAQVLCELDLMPYLNYAHDPRFQKEIYHGLCEVANNKADCKFQIAPSLQSLAYHFSFKCSEHIIQLNLQRKVRRQLILHRAKTQDEKPQLYFDYLSIYEDFCTKIATLRNSKGLTLDERLDFISGTLSVVEFIEYCHPSLKTLGFRPLFKGKNKGLFKNYFKKMNEIIKDYIMNIFNLISEIDLEQSLNLRHISDLKVFGKVLTDLLKYHLDLFLSWHKLLNGGDDEELELSRNSITTLYKLSIQLQEFYKKFFVKYPEGDRVKLTEYMQLFSAEDDFKKRLKNANEINKIIEKFHSEETIKDALYQAEMQVKLKLSNKSGKFLCELEKKEKEFRLIRQGRKTKKSEACNPENKMQLTKVIAKKNPPQESQSTRYLDSALAALSSHQCHHALVFYDLGYKHAILEANPMAQLSAVDGLAIAQGKILIKEVEGLLKLMEGRIRNPATPFSSALQIEVEQRIFKVIFGSIYLEKLNGKLINLSQGIILTEDKVKFGLEFSISIMVELICFIKAKTLSLYDKYEEIIKLNREQRTQFIIKLGTEVASRSQRNLTAAQIKCLGDKKFAELGLNNYQKGKIYSQETRELSLLKELKPYFAELHTPLQNILATIKGAKAENCKNIIKKIKCYKTNAKLIRSTLPFNPSVEVQELFSLLASFSKVHCFYGSALINFILQLNCQTSLSYKSFEFITNVNDQKMLNDSGFIKIDSANLYVHHSLEKKVELRTVNQELFGYFCQKIFTISTLFCQAKDGGFLIHDPTGQGLRDLEQMRLVMTKDPIEEFAKDPCGILACFDLMLENFHPNLAIIDALNNFNPPKNFERSQFDAQVKAKFLQLGLQGRKKYLKFFIQYDLLLKLFNLNYDCDLAKTLGEFEKNYQLSSLFNSHNPNSLFVVAESRPEAEEFFIPIATPSTQYGT
ncbi:MAG: hypothetical protein H0U70_01675 [Tatlockia sp.]|nr:hypothetical protein [Tatlockia sp.]